MVELADHSAEATAVLRLHSDLVQIRVEIPSSAALPEAEDTAQSEVSSSSSSSSDESEQDLPARDEAGSHASLWSEGVDPPSDAALQAVLWVPSRGICYVVVRRLFYAFLGLHRVL